MGLLQHCLLTLVKMSFQIQPRYTWPFAECYGNLRKPISVIGGNIQKTFKTRQLPTSGSRLSLRCLRSVYLKIRCVWVWPLSAIWRVEASCDGYLGLWAWQGTTTSLKKQCFQAWRGIWVWPSPQEEGPEPGSGSEAKGPTIIGHTSRFEGLLFRLEKKVR